MNVSTTGEPGSAVAGAPGVSAADQGAHIGADETAEALKRGPIGALTVSIIAISLLLLGWILFYFLIFVGRGPIG